MNKTTTYLQVFQEHNKKISTEFVRSLVKMFQKSHENTRKTLLKNSFNTNNAKKLLHNSTNTPLKVEFKNTIDVKKVSILKRQKYFSKHVQNDMK